jgi:hypothetical protein
MPTGAAQAAMFGASSLLGVVEDDMPLITSVSLTGTAPGATSLDLTGYSVVDVHAVGVSVNTDDSRVYMRISDDNGVSYANSDYYFDANVFDSTGAAEHWFGAPGATGLPLTDNTNGWKIGNSTNETGDWSVRLYNPGGATWKKWSSRGVFVDNAGVMIRHEGDGLRQITGDIDAISMYVDGVVTFSSGTMYIYGLANS